MKPNPKNLLLKNSESVILEDALFETEPFSEQANQVLALYIKPEHYPALIDNYDNLLARAEVYEEEAKRCNKIKSKLESFAEHVKAHMLNGMVALGQKKLEFPFKKLTVVGNAPSVEIVNEEDVPSKYRRYSIKITDQNIEKIKKVLSANNIEYEVSSEINKKAILDEFRKYKSECESRDSQLKINPNLNIPEPTRVDVAGTKIIDTKVHLLMKD